MRPHWIIGLIALYVVAPVPTFGEEHSEQRTFHEKLSWKAEDFFEDPQVVALCRAIEANDLEEIDRLVAAGADVNARGKGDMTPLLWAFPDNSLARFTRMLEHGADPNVFTTSDFNTLGSFGLGDSVTHMACKTSFPGYFEAVFEHGGDPNLVTRDGVGFKDTPLFTVIGGEAPLKAKKVLRLIELSADLDQVNSLGRTSAMYATICAEYGIALILLEAGADYRHVNPNWGGRYRLVHSVRREARNRSTWTPQQAEDYETLVAWLEARRETMEDAQKDIDLAS